MLSSGSLFLDGVTQFVAKGFRFIKRSMQKLDVVVIVSEAGGFTLTLDETCRLLVNGEKTGYYVGIGFYDLYKLRKMSEGVYNFWIGCFTDDIDVIMFPGYLEVKVGNKVRRFSYIPLSVLAKKELLGGGLG